MFIPLKVINKLTMISFQTRPGLRHPAPAPRGLSQDHDLRVFTRGPPPLPPRKDDRDASPSASPAVTKAAAWICSSSLLFESNRDQTDITRLFLWVTNKS